MKKKFVFFISLLLTAVLCAGVFGACTPPVSQEKTAAYTVRFNDNYAGDYAKKEVKEGELVSLPAAPDRTGYEFVGWYLSEEENAAEIFDAASPITANITVYAKWRRNEAVSLVTLKFRDYRTPDAVYAVNKGEAFAEPQKPVYDENGMCDFVAWYADESCTEVYGFSSPVDSDIALYAGWEKVKAYVTFDPNYPAGPAADVVIAELGGTVTAPVDPTRPQYEFGGWYSARVGGLQFAADEPIEADTTFYAHWLRSEYTVMFDANGAKLASGITKKYVVKRGTSAAENAAAIEAGMTYVGHDFAGWYLVKTDPDGDEPLPEQYLADLSAINDDLMLYAAWTRQTYTVEFDYNYPDAPENPASQSIKYGDLVTDPGVPERDGYLFGGWFGDAGLSEQFTLDTPVAGSMKLLAKWIDNSETHDDVTVTFRYSADTGEVRHATVTVPFNGTVADKMPDAPSVAGYLFGGWYADAGFKRAFNPNGNLTENTVVYGKMLKKYTFEAEATDLEGKHGQGTSTNSEEEQMIMDSTFVRGGDVSHGYFVRELYYNGAFLDFEITAAEEVDDAVIYLRVSSESYQFFTTKDVDGVTYNYLSDEEFKFVLNGDEDNYLRYGGLYMPMANIEEREDLAQNKTPFEDCFIMSGVHLNQGKNFITLLVDNNNNHGGTFHAEAPIIDCMYIYASAELTLKDYKFYERPNVTRG